jgi:hypothetical protein
VSFPDVWDDLRQALAGHSSAISFVETIVVVLHFWDDLIDKDRVLPDEEVNHAMWLALIELPRNDFYRRNFAELNPILRQAILNWHLATQVEREGSDDERTMAFVLRSSYVDLISATLTLCLGVQTALPYIRKLRQHTHSETLEGYLQALKVEEESRNVLWKPQSPSSP